MHLLHKVGSLKGRINDLPALIVSGMPIIPHLWQSRFKSFTSVN